MNGPNLGPEDVPEELRASFTDDVLPALPSIWEQALGDLSREHLDALIEIQENAEGPEDVTSALDANPDLLIALGRGIAGSLDRPPEFRADLALAHEALRRYEATGELAALDDAIGAYGRITDHPEFASYSDTWQLSSLANSGACYVKRYSADGAAADLERGVSVLREVVRRTPEDSPRLPGRLNNLGSALASRYERLGEPEDLEDAVEHLRSAVEKTPENSPFYPRHSDNLGSAYRRLYLSFGDLTALDKTLEAYLRSVGATPDGHPERPGRLHNLATGWSNRFDRIGDFDDLEEALRLDEEAVQTSPPGSPGRDLFLRGLGGGLLTRFRFTHDPADLDGAVVRFREAVSEAHAGSPDLPGHLASLGGTLVTRFDLSGDRRDLDEAIETLEGAAAEVPPASPDASHALHGLGRGLAARHALTGNSGDLKRATVLLERVCDQVLVSDVGLEEGLRCARHWGMWASGRRAWADAARAYGYADRILERLLRTQLFRRGQELWLREAQGLPGMHAYALAKMGDLREAVLALDRGRARLLGEALGRNRADLEGLRESGRGDLRERYEEAAERWNGLARAAAESVPADSGEASSYERRLVEATEAARAELEAATEAIRRVPGYELFLTPIDFDEILSAADGCPLVYLATTPEGSLVLVVAGGKVEAVWSDFAAEDLGSLLSRTGDETEETYPAYRRVVGGYLVGQLLDPGLLDEELREVLPALGEALMGPSAERLRGIGVGEAVLVPAGILPLLPLHAASYLSGGETVHFLDEFDVSYAPNARSITLAWREAGRVVGHRLVGVGNPLPSHEPLKAAEAELREIEALFQAGRSRTLYADGATKSALLEAIPGGTHLHLACHGGFDTGSLLESGLVLSGDERLTLGEILYGTVEIFGARLVTLSACQSAISDFAGLPDENVGLPTALMQAGVPGVVGTLWAVNDFSTALLMVRFYELHLHGDRAAGTGPLPPARALCRAQRWLKGLTWGEIEGALASHPYLAESLRRALEKEPRETALRGLRDEHGREMRPFADSPYHWAPFLLVGA